MKEKDCPEFNNDDYEPILKWAAKKSKQKSFGKMNFIMKKEKNPSKMINLLFGH
jgi:hypothetical protein